MAFFTDDDLSAIGLTLFTASLSTLLIFPFGVALAWLLARKSWPGKTLVETIVALPLVMPPVATGLILLNLLGRHGPLGQFIQSVFGTEIVFTWKAVVVAMAVMSFPFLVRTVRLAFEEINPRLEQVARTLGATPLRVFLTITLPLASRGLLAGAVWAFARALGEFGATILVAGNIPGRTTVLSVAIYGDIQLGHDDHAYQLLLVSATLAFAAILFSNQFSKPGGTR
jgi:molybdate transport system permease protein